jgi:hypothetical protein
LRSKASGTRANNPPILSQGATLSDTMQYGDVFGYIVFNMIKRHHVTVVFIYVGYFGKVLVI